MNLSDQLEEWQRAQPERAVRLANRSSTKRVWDALVAVGVIVLALLVILAFAAFVVYAVARAF